VNSRVAGAPKTPFPTIVAFVRISQQHAHYKYILDHGFNGKPNKYGDITRENNTSQDEDLNVRINAWES
jgi:hypothetical protein